MKIANLAEKFTRLKTSIGGNREKLGYEHSFGMPYEAQQHITSPNMNITRIISELEFSLALTDDRENIYDEIIESAIDLLTRCVRSEGVVTNTAVLEAENLLSPIESAAKEYSLICAAHAHIDMNWMWSWQETVASTLATFRTMLALMEQYPDFCYSQSQASVYKIVEEYDPELMEQIKTRIAEGRWEVTATAWVETDKNMPNTESLLHHIKCTRDYLRDSWGVDPNSLELDFSPDTFGHSAQIPEIDTFGGVKYYYHCRGVNTPNALYRWKSPSGSELLMYREQYWYNSAITPHIGIGIIDISRKCAGFKTGLIVYGVGDHGGGATRRDIEMASEMMQWKIFPRIRFGTIREFFHEAESVRSQLPLIDHELNFIFDGCYTTQSRIKRGNRNCESALVDSAAFSAINKAYLRNDHTNVIGRQFTKAWQNVLFTHFHDILTGSCVQDSREHAMGLYSDSIASANTIQSNAVREIAENIDTSMIIRDEDNDVIRFSQSEGAGVGYGIPNFTGVPSPERGTGRTRVYHVFNPSGFDRIEPIEITVWDWTGDMRNIAVEDSEENPIQYTLLDSNLQQYWDHKFFRFMPYITVPAYGYTTVVLREKKIVKYPFYLGSESGQLGFNNNAVLENEYIRAEFDMLSGNMKSLKDIETGEEMIKNGEFAGLALIDTELNGNSAWVIGRYLSIKPITDIKHFSVYSRGDIQHIVHFDATVLSSHISVDAILNKGAKSITYNIVADWNEANGGTVPVLAYVFPHAYDTENYLCDIPAGDVLRRPENHDIPALQYVCAVNGGICGKNDLAAKSAALITDSKYGYRAFDGKLISTLINTAQYPDKYPERGIHNIKVTTAVISACPKRLENYASALNHSLCYVSMNPHKGILPTEMSFLRLEKGTAVISSVDTSDDGSMFIRLYENCGCDTDVTIAFAQNVKSAQMVNLMEKPTDGSVQINGKSITFNIAKNKLAQVKIVF